MNSTIQEFWNHVKLFDKVWQSKYDLGLRLALIFEEAGELCQSIIKGNSKEDQAEELADLLYVCLGFGDVAGYDMEAAMKAVMAKNQNKIDRKGELKLSPMGKVLKPQEPT